jgi:hypothetical protein
MNSIKSFLSNDRMAQLAAAIFVPAFLSMIGFGIYHGKFHISSNTVHCHENVCHKH